MRVRAGGKGWREWRKVHWRWRQDRGDLISVPLPHLTALQLFPYSERMVLVSVQTAGMSTPKSAHVPNTNCKHESRVHVFLTCLFGLNSPHVGVSFTAFNSTRPSTSTATPSNPGRPAKPGVVKVVPQSMTPWEGLGTCHWFWVHLEAQQYGNDLVGLARGWKLRHFGTLLCLVKRTAGARPNARSRIQTARHHTQV